MGEIFLFQFLVQSYYVHEPHLRQNRVLRVHPMLVSLHLVAHEVLNSALSDFLSVLQETQDLLEAAMKVSQGLNIVLKALILYKIEVMVDSDACISIEGGLLDALSDF